MTDLPMQDPAIPSPRADVVPVSPDVVAMRPPATAADELRRLMTSFRVLQMHHARVLHHESTARGLNATDVRFVFFLAASEGTGVTPKQAGEYLELSTGAMTSLIDRLADRGHIERRPNPLDRRSVLLHLTSTGSDVATEIGAIYEAAFSTVIAPEYIDPLAQAFELVGDALQRRSSA